MSTVTWTLDLEKPNPFSNDYIATLSGEPLCTHGVLARLGWYFNLPKVRPPRTIVLKASLVASPQSYNCRLTGQYRRLEVLSAKVEERQDVQLTEAIPLSLYDLLRDAFAQHERFHLTCEYEQ